VHPGTATEPLDRLLVRTGQALQRFIQRAAAAHGLNVTALEVLGALGEHDGCSHRDLAGRLRLAPATLTPVLDALEAAGALTRTRDGTDRRVVRVSISDRGRERYVAVARGVGRAVAELPQPSPALAAGIRTHLLDILAAVDRAAP
jgi:DNA-binding MarR family transcriptional regulator